MRCGYRTLKATILVFVEDIESLCTSKASWPSPTSLGHALNSEILNWRPLPSSWKVIAHSRLPLLIMINPMRHRHIFTFLFLKKKLTILVSSTKPKPSTIVPYHTMDTRSQIQSLVLQSAFPSPKPVAFCKNWTTICNHVFPETMSLLPSLESPNKNPATKIIN